MGRARWAASADEDEAQRRGGGGCASRWAASSPVRPRTGKGRAGGCPGRGRITPLPALVHFLVREGA